MAHEETATIEEPQEPTHTVGAAPDERRVRVWGMLAQFEDVSALMTAAHKLRQTEYVHWEVHSPFPVHGIDKVVGNRPTILPWFVLLGALGGFFGGLFLVWYTNATNFDSVPLEAWEGYPFLISGKPIFSLPANIPPVFETTVLASAITAVVGMFLLDRLPMLYHPLLANDRFRKATDDGLFIVVEARDKQFDLTKTAELLEGFGATAVEPVEEETSA